MKLVWLQPWIQLMSLLTNFTHIMNLLRFRNFQFFLEIFTTGLNSEFLPKKIKRIELIVNRQPFRRLEASSPVFHLVRIFKESFQCSCGRRRPCKHNKWPAKERTFPFFACEYLFHIPPLPVKPRTEWDIVIKLKLKSFAVPEQAAFENRPDWINRSRTHHTEDPQIWEKERQKREGNLK